MALMEHHSFFLGGGRVLSMRAQTNPNSTGFRFMVDQPPGMGEKHKKLRDEI